MINRTGFGLLALGAVLFSAFLYLVVNNNIFGLAESELDPAIQLGLCTLLFVLPYVLWELTRRANLLTLFYLVVLVPAAHFVAAYVAAWVQTFGEEEPVPQYMVGLAGGAAGAALALILLFVLGLRKAGSGPAVFLAAFVLLAAVGAGGAHFAAEHYEDPSALIYWLFLPWQLVFAFFLSALLRPSPARGTLAATD